MENTQLIGQFAAALDGACAQLAPQVQVLISKSFEERCNECDTPLEEIQLANAYAYVVVSLCFAYLKSQGVDTTHHPIMRDLERVKSYMKRQKLVEQGKTEEDEAAVAVTGAKRFIEGVLGRSTGPAISEDNFKGKHTKFDEGEADGESKSTSKSKSKSDEVSIRTKRTQKKDKKVKGKGKGKVAK